MKKPELHCVTIETIDQAVYDWFNVIVDAHVSNESGDRKKVKVVMAGGERWVTSRQKKDGGNSSPNPMRDDKGALILPIISIRRMSIDPDVSMSALGTESPTITYSKIIDGKTNDLMNLNDARTPALREKKPVIHEVTTIPFPDRSIMTYELTIQAQYTREMNLILEKIFHELDINKSFVAPFDPVKKHSKSGEIFDDREKINCGYVVGFMDDSSSSGDNFDEFTDAERIVKYMTTLKVPATLQLDPEGEKVSANIKRTSFKLDFSDERVYFVDDKEELEKIFGK